MPELSLYIFNFVGEWAAMYWPSVKREGSNCLMKIIAPSRIFFHHPQTYSENYHWGYFHQKHMYCLIFLTEPALRFADDRFIWTYFHYIVKITPHIQLLRQIKFALGKDKWAKMKTKRRLLNMFWFDLIYIHTKNALEFKW